MAHIREKIFYSLISHGIFPDKQKGGTEELPYVDQHILNESKTRKKI